MSEELKIYKFKAFVPKIKSKERVTYYFVISYLF